MASQIAEQVTPEALVDLPVPQDLCISPDGLKVVYSVSPSVAYLSPIVQTGENALSSLWVAHISAEKSARQITSGLFYDQLPQWSPGPSDEGCIAFISDRAKPGESSAIYLISLDGGEAYPISEVGNKKPISELKWNPDGKYIAFLSSDEKSEEQNRREKQTGGAKVYGEDWEFCRLRCLHVTTRRVETLFGDDEHVTDFTWNEEGTQIAFISQRTPDLNSGGYYGSRFRTISLVAKTQNAVKKHNFPGPAHDMLWIKDKVYFLAGFSPDKSATSSTVYQMSIETGEWSRYCCGSLDCAVGLRSTKGLLVVLVQKGLKDEIEVYDTEEETVPQLTYGGDIREIHTYDGVIYNDRKEFVLAFATSDCKTPPEVFSRIFPATDVHEGDAVDIHSQSNRLYKLSETGRMFPLSQHGSRIAALNIGEPKPVYLHSIDGGRGDGILIAPSNQMNKSSKPTVVMIHGGPYSRITNAFNLLYFYWVPYLVSAGYNVLCPNYRGGSSHGEDYASQARGAMGTTDYDDVIALLKEAISQGFVDRDRVAIGGYSQGGFLSYLSMTRQDFHFKAAICGAGISDWDAHIMASDAPWYNVESIGKAPWETSADNTKARRGSPIWHMKHIKTPILILHGEDDVRVPFSQAVAFHRGCLHHNVPCEFVAYPREGHVIKEREHLIDMLKRIRRFCDLHLR